MRKLTILTAALVAFAVPATAAAKNVKQTGYVVGDKAATIKLRVQVKHGEAIKVAGFRAQNVIARCGKDKIRITLTVHSPIAVERDGDFKDRIADGQGGFVMVGGHVNNRGRATVGNVKTNEFQQGKRTCRVAKQRFKTSARG